MDDVLGDNDVGKEHGDVGEGGDIGGRRKKA